MRETPWVVRDQDVAGIVDVGTEEECRQSAALYNEQYQTNTYWATPLN